MSENPLALFVLCTFLRDKGHNKLCCLLLYVRMKAHWRLSRMEKQNGEAEWRSRMEKQNGAAKWSSKVERLKLKTK
ncbi:hypothetical protein POVCU1_008200 [Plasmodium ovale curtisi]|uniref:Uncharacterized protein n=1 Tax=Plasmodium ovale curtisi TaxID=864141 RepID=A0A1A8VTJ4_PLAOA|nr:hypothetical protein POVCU1_008200 [Plasmodium ovale curtisi]